uniref:Uncharacterized protein n=1 Tax=Plectus sambesii TaxID=2011161 RepID=A0A914VQX4_9BILA
MSASAHSDGSAAHGGTNTQPSDFDV